jgi:hypothetical protein
MYDEGSDEYLPCADNTKQEEEVISTKSDIISQPSIHNVEISGKSVQNSSKRYSIHPSQRRSENTEAEVFEKYFRCTNRTSVDVEVAESAKNSRNGR